MVFDAMVTNPGRLRILAALAVDPAQPFVQLRRQTGLTDGNLCTHARRLQSAGLIAIEKTLQSGKPLTTLHLTTAGRQALTAHAESLLAALQGPAEHPELAAVRGADDPIEDDWID